MNPKTALARRYYHHVLNGGHLKPDDLAFMVKTIEELDRKVESAEAIIKALTSGGTIEQRHSRAMHEVAHYRNPYGEPEKCL